ncbi:MAG TPA: ABC-2 family transporter protein [Candidatus Woesebacteria bacterium]|nr:ABC-2 family transporter protein [Candidatus Woesebacteria bacterium]
MVNIRKYLTFAKLNCLSNMEFRSALFVWFLVELLSLVSSVFIWLAIFRSQQTVGGYDQQGIILYYLLVPIIGMISSVHISEDLPNKIKLGEISSQLVKPYHLATGFFAMNIGTRITQILIKIPFFISICLVLQYFTNIRLSPLYIFLGLFIAFFGLIIHFLIDFSISAVAFWSDDVWYLSHLKFILLMVFGGLTFPLDLLPTQLASIFNLLPFKYIYYVPVKVATGSIGLTELAPELGLFSFWLVVFAVLTHFLWKMGIRRYGAYGN